MIWCGARGTGVSGGGFENLAHEGDRRGVHVGAEGEGQVLGARGPVLLAGALEQPGCLARRVEISHGALVGSSAKALAAGEHLLDQGGHVNHAGRCADRRARWPPAKPPHPLERGPQGLDRATCCRSPTRVLTTRPRRRAPATVTTTNSRTRAGGGRRCRAAGGGWTRRGRRRGVGGGGAGGSIRRRVTTSRPSMLRTQRDRGPPPPARSRGMAKRRSPSLTTRALMMARVMGRGSPSPWCRCRPRSAGR